jgi:uncharacterized protein YjbJ (UPF0337 family)
MSRKTQIPANQRNLHVPFRHDDYEDLAHETSHEDGGTAHKGGLVNKDLIAGEWNQIKGKIKETWGELTDDDITRISGVRDQLIGKLQETYGYARERAEREVREFEQCCILRHN